MTEQFFKSRLEKLNMRFSFHSNFAGYSNQERDIKFLEIKDELVELENTLFARIEKDYFDEMLSKVKELKRMLNAEIRNHNRLVESNPQR